MSLVKVKAKYQIVIPEEVRRRISLEVGDTLEIEERDGMLIAKPVMTIEKSQAYFWTEEWQRGEGRLRRQSGQGSTKSSRTPMRLSNG